MARKDKHRKAEMILQVPHMHHVAQGKYWFFLPVPFLYHRFPFKAGERVLVTVTEAPKK